MKAGVPSAASMERILNVTSSANNDGHPAVMVMSSPSLRPSQRYPPVEIKMNNKPIIEPNVTYNFT